GRGARDAGRGLGGRDLHRMPAVDVREASGDGRGERVDLLFGSDLAGERGHPAALDPAGDDPLERLEVVRDVDGEAVGGDGTVDVDADRADLAIAHPDPGEALDHARGDTVLGERIDHDPLHVADVGVDVVA